MKNGCTVYRLFDDREEKHYVISSFDHQKLEELINEYKKNQEKVYAKEFVSFLHKHDPEAKEIEVKDLYF